MVGQESDGPVEPANKSDLIDRSLNQELELGLDRIGADEHRAAGGAAAHAGMVLRLVMVASGLDVPAGGAVRQRERPIKRHRIRISARGETCEQSLDHEQIGRENCDPAPDHRSVAMAHSIDLRFLDITVAVVIK
ncbi:hypothetical protein [Bosea sp. ANAM02]|uniref:hypothetical protein n=1 Tax=Bosea sp. ANAM02 TaxID=2020412 RepID=UPI0015658C0A|nr:hypothetical protein [Bosea sp. ANAM02]